MGGDNIDGLVHCVDGTWEVWGICNVCNRVIIMGLWEYLYLDYCSRHPVVGYLELVRCDLTIIDYLWGISSPIHSRSLLLLSLMTLSPNASFPLP